MMPLGTRPILIVGEQTQNLGDLLLRHQLQHVLVTHTASSQLRACEWQRLDSGSTGTTPQASSTTIYMKHQPLAAALAAVRASIVIGPGQMLRDNMSAWHLFAIALLATISRLTGGRTYVLGVSMGRLSNRPRIFIWKLIVLLSDRVALRDPKSWRNAQRLFGRHSKIRETSDLFFLKTPVTHPADIQSDDRPHESFVLVAPCTDQTEGRFLSAERAASIGLAAARAANLRSIVFAAHDLRSDMDAKLVVDCCDILRARNVAGLQVSSLIPSNLEALLTAYADAGVVVTNRLHAMLLGVVARKPVYSVFDGSGKLQTYAEEFGLTTIWNDGTYDNIEADLRRGLADFDSSRYAPMLERHERLAWSNFEGLFFQAGRTAIPDGRRPRVEQGENA